MMTYVTAFIFYTLAMVGIMLVAFVVYKKTYLVNKENSRGIIKVIDTLPIGSKKLLHVVTVRDESFLIATDAEQTTFLSKLSSTVSVPTKDAKEFMEAQALQNDNVILDKIYNQNFKQNLIQKNIQNPEDRFDDPQRRRAQEIQKQFKELYEKDDETIQQSNFQKNTAMHKLFANQRGGNF